MSDRLIMSIRLIFTTLLTFTTLCQIANLAFAVDSNKDKDKDKSAKSICVNGADEKDDEVLKNFKTTTGGLKEAFDKYLKNNPGICSHSTVPQIDKTKTAARAMVATEDPPMLHFYRDDEPRPKLIKRECIRSALERNPASSYWTCTGKDQLTPKKVSGSDTQCYTDEMVSYTQYAINAAITCLSQGRAPIDSRIFYQKFNVESAFNYSISYDGGKGLGQLTTPAIGELAHPEKGRARYILEELANNNDDLCAPFKKIAAQDLKNRPKSVNSSPCNLVGTSDGLTRNLIYSIGYYVFNRDQLIAPKLMSRSTKLASNKEVVNALAAVAYSADGWDKARSIIDGYRVNAKTDPEKFIKYAQSKSAYLKNIRGKIGEAYCIKHGMDNSSDACKAAKTKIPEAEYNGDTCVK